MSAEQTPDIETARAGEVWQEADNVLLLCIEPGAWWQDFRGARVPWDAPLIARPLRRLLDAEGNLVAPVLTAAVREEAERIAQAIEKRRNEHWQKHLREHPYADGSSCPGDYAAHDAYYDAARIARADRVAEPQHEAATSGKESEASDE